MIFVCLKSKVSTQCGPTCRILFESPGGPNDGKTLPVAKLGTFVQVPFAWSKLKALVKFRQ